MSFLGSHNFRHYIDFRFIEICKIFRHIQVE